MGAVLQPRAVLASGGTSDQAVSFLENVAHDDTLTADALAPPLTQQWSRSDLGGTVSYPLIAGGKVFVTVQGPYTSTTGSYPPKWIYALDENTGATIWSKPEGGVYGFLSAAYDNGSVYLLNHDGLLQSLDASTGAVNWTLTLTAQYSFEAPPTAANGVVYVYGGGSGGNLFAVSESTGTLLWTSPILNIGGQSAPTLSSNSVFVAMECDNYAFSTQASNFGQLLWSNYYQCSGGDAHTSVLGPAGLYVRQQGIGGSNLILDPSTGKQVGSFSSRPPPSFSGTTTFVVNGGVLTATDPNGNALWTFSGDGGLDTSPLLVNNDIYIGSSSGMLYGVNATTGQSVWSTNTGAAFQPTDQDNSNMISALGAGEGHLLVPAGSTLTAYTGTPDTTAPVITYNVKGAQGNNGWYTSPTTVTWSVSDPESGIASSSGCSTTTISTDTSGTTLTCSATNGFGLSSTSSVSLKVDVTAPSLNCGSPPSGWSASDISVACSPTDGTSGVATTDGYFTLSTSVAAGTETSSASTPSRQVCDLAGNCITAGPFTGLKVDKKSPTITLTAPTNTTYTLGQSVLASYSCADGGSGVASCAGPVSSGSAISTSSVGSKTFSVSASDTVGNAATPVTTGYSVTYGVCQSSVPQIKAGRTGSVTIMLCNAAGANVSSSAITVTAAGVYTAAGVKVQILTNNFSYKSGSGYTESVSTAGLASGSYYVAFTATGDPVTHQAAFTVK